MKTNLQSQAIQVSLLLSFCLLITIPSTAQWVRKADALKKRTEVTSVVYKNKLYDFSGFGNTALEIEPSCEVYDLETNTWSLLASMPNGKWVTHQSAVLIDNTVWHIGGRVGKSPGPLTSEIWIYNFTTNAWSPGPQIVDPATGIPLPWAAGGAALIGRTLHIFGGFINTACDNDQEKYHLTLNVDSWLANPTKSVQWQNTRKIMPVKRNHFSTIVLNGKIYALGGQFGHDCNGGEDMPYSHVYDPVLDTWTELTRMPTARSHTEGSSFSIDGKIYLVGGQVNNGTATNKITIFDPAANNGKGSWSDDPSFVLPSYYEWLSAKVIGNTFVIAHGGLGSSGVPSNLAYTRNITRNPVHKLGFTASCLPVKTGGGSTVTLKNLLYTTEGTRTYTTSSNAGWLKVSKNPTGNALSSGVDIEVTINTAGLAPGNYTGVITATASGTGTAYSSGSFCVNLTVEGAAPEISTSKEMIFSGVKGTTSPAQTLLLTNTGSTTLQISSVSITGTHAAAFGLVSFAGTPLQIPAAKSAPIQVVFKPSATTVGSLTASLRLQTNDADEGVVNVDLYGLSANGLQSNSEPPLDWIVKTLGYNINVGGTGLILGTSPSPIGDEVLMPLFKKAANGPVTIKAVARYSPDDLLDFGYYTKNNGVPQLHKVATIDLQQEQTLYPTLLGGGATSFDPGTAVFGLYTGSTSYSPYMGYTENSLNKGPLAHVARIYPLKNRLGQAIPNSYLVAFEPAVNGDYQDYVFVISNVTAPPTTTPPVSTLRINAGGEAFMASGNRQFIADSYFEDTNRTFSIPGGDILNTADDELYYSERSSPAFSYNIPVANGNYTVVLHFAEIFFGAPDGREGGAGKRLFHVDIEGDRKLTDYDVFAAAGGAMKAIQTSFPMSVTDGILNIDFSTGSANMPKVSAIEVLPTTNTNRVPVLAAIGGKSLSLGQTLQFTASASDADTHQTKTFSLLDAPQGAVINASSGNFEWTPTQTGSFSFTVKVTDSGSPALSDQEQITVNVEEATFSGLRINAGGTSFTASGSRYFMTDGYFGGANRVHSIEGGDILNTTDDELYYSERSSPAFSYNIPVANGNYTVVLHFAEIFFGAPDGREGGAGKRLFHVDIEGERKLTDYDVFAAAGGAMKAIQTSFPMSVTDGILNIDFSTGSANMPKVSAIEVLPASNNTSRVTLATVDQAEDMLLYPNPSAGEFTLTYSAADAAQGRIQILNAQGKEVLQKTVDLQAGENAIRVLSADLPAGMYLVHLSSEKKTIVKKLVIRSR
jgi:hypothetical protein